MQFVSKWILTGALVSLVSLVSACKSDPPSPQVKADGAKTKAAAAATASAAASAIAAPPPASGPDDMAAKILRCSESWLGNAMKSSERCEKLLELWSAGGVEAAVAKYKAACDGGDGTSCMLLIGGLGHPKSPMRSKDAVSFAEDTSALLIKACGLGEPNACYEVVDRYTCASDDQYYEKSPLVCTNQIKKHLKGKKSADYAAMLEPGCNKGHAPSCTKAGDQLKAAKGQVDEVTEHYKKACKLGDPDGCHNAAQVAKLFGQLDEERALMSSKFAIEERKCRQLRECRDIAADYKYGWYLPEHLPKIREMLSSDCEKKSADDDDCLELVEMQVKGAGGPADVASALPRLKTICDKPFGSDDDHYTLDPIVKSCRILARLYREGTGVEKDEAKAKALLKKVCVERDPPGIEIPAACRELREMGK